MRIAHTAYIALGSNLPSTAGSPYHTVGAAISRLRTLGEVTAQSSIYQTDPVGYADQPPFLNAVVALRTQLDAPTLLERLLEIEREFGRERGQTMPKGPRTLDLDLLLDGGLILNLPYLTLPHPSLADRRFVLAPFAEIAPDVIHPVLGKTISTLLSELPNRGENLIAGVRAL